MALLKLCTPSASEYASQLAMDSTRSLQQHQQRQHLHHYSTSYSALPPIPVRAGVGGSPNVAAAAFGRTMGTNPALGLGLGGIGIGNGIGSAVILPSSGPRPRPPMSSATLGVPGRSGHTTRGLNGRDPLGYLQAQQLQPEARQRSAAPSIQQAPSSFRPTPAAAFVHGRSATHIDVSITSDTIAPVVVTPRAAAALARLERSASAAQDLDHEAAELARVSSVSSVRAAPVIVARSPGPPPSAPAGFALATSFPPRPPAGHDYSAQAAASAAASSAQLQLPSPGAAGRVNSGGLTGLLESEGMLPMLQSPVSRLAAAAAAAAAAAHAPRPGSANFNNRQDDVEMQKIQSV